MGKERRPRKYERGIGRIQRKNGSGSKKTREDR